MPKKKKPKKNVNGMGSIRQLDNGKWEYRFTMPDRKPDGSQDRRSCTADTAEQAVEKSRAIIAGHKPSAKVNASDLTVATLFETWWPIHARAVRASTLSTDKFTKQRIVDGLGSMLANDVRPSHINAHTQKQLENGLSDKTAGKDRGMLFQLFSYAVEEELTDRNPVTKKSSMRPRDTTLAVERTDAFSPDEVEKILEAQARLSALKGVRGIAPSLVQAAEATVVWLFSGVREGELLDLSTAVVDESGAGMSIVGSLNIVEGKPVPGPTKSLAGMRRAEVSRAAQPVLASMRRSAGDGRLLRSRNSKTEYYGASGFRDAYYAFIKSIDGIRVLPPNCCRHTHATMLAAVNVPPALIQYQMGHNDYQLTSSIYTHVKLYMSPEAVKKIKAWGVGEFYWGHTGTSLGMVGDEAAKQGSVGDGQGSAGQKEKPQEPHGF